MQTWKIILIENVLENMLEKFSSISTFCALIDDILFCGTQYYTPIASSTVDVQIKKSHLCASFKSCMVAASLNLQSLKVEKSPFSS